MSLSWFQRKARLGTLLQSRGNEDEDALALDRLLHGQSVIGQTSKTVELDMLRFQDRDVCVVGTLEYGQFGVIDLVKCYLDGRVYVRKSIEKRFAIKTREQCSPQTERDILLQATKTNSSWAPHLLCAFQTPTHLNLVMRYAEGGTLWDVLESSPYGGKVPEHDLRWWVPQVISAIHWCHSQGFAHRDIKPHNFVLTPGARILIIDFGSAAPLLPPQADGSQLLPSRYCLVPCGTCDYISPEILQAHEEALVALEMDDDSTGMPAVSREEVEGYGLETDWWSLGAMLYEMAYGVTPFFAKDIRQTYLKIMNHEQSLRFDVSVPMSTDYQNLLCRLLTGRERRIGRKNVMEITEHPFFRDIDWSTLSDRSAPSNIHLPQFTYPETVAPSNGPVIHASDESHSQPFAFSALFQSSVGSSVGLSILHATPSRRAKSSFPVEDTPSFIGFSWGPTQDTFPSIDSEECRSFDHTSAANLNTPQHSSTLPRLSSETTARVAYSFPFVTPIRPNPLSPFHTLPRMTASRRAPRRAVSDREAMNQLVDCVGLSARKKVLESGRKPRILTSFSRVGTVKKELRFRPSHVLISNTPRVKYRLTSSVTGSESSDTDVDGPPSPSPSPRPGSAMSMMSRRSGTPTMTGSYSQRTSSGRGTISNNNTVLLIPPKAHGSLAHRNQGANENDAASYSFEDALNAFEGKHSSLMEDIMGIESRLTDLSMLWRRED